MTGSWACVRTAGSIASTAAPFGAGRSAWRSRPSVTVPTGRRGAPARPRRSSRGRWRFGRAVGEAHRGGWEGVLASTVRVRRDFDPAEEAVQDAYVQALRTWTRDGVPDEPVAWLRTAARNAALNAMHRRRTLATK